jgi:hypothetical protein
MKNKAREIITVDAILKRNRISSRKLDREIDDTRRNADKIESDILSIFNKIRFLF